MKTGWIPLLVWVGCGNATMAPAGAQPDAATPPDAMDVPDAPPDAGIDAPAPTRCDPLARFEAPVGIPGLDAPSLAISTPRLSPDELTLYFRGQGAANDLFVARRASRSEPFGAPAPLAGQNTPASEADPYVSPDGLGLWFASNRIASEGAHLYVTKRPSLTDPFDPPRLAPVVNAADRTASDFQPFVTADGKELWFTSTRAGRAGDLWRAVSQGGGFAAPALVAEVSSDTADDGEATLSADGLTLYLTSSRPAATSRGGYEIWRSRRPARDQPFTAPVIVDELDSASNDNVSWISPDNCRVYGSTDDRGVTHAFMASRRPTL